MKQTWRMVVEVQSRRALLIRSRDAASFDNRSRKVIDSPEYQRPLNLEIQHSKIPLENLRSYLVQGSVGYLTSGVYRKQIGDNGVEI